MTKQASYYTIALPGGRCDWIIANRLVRTDEGGLQFFDGCDDILAEFSPGTWESFSKSDPIFYAGTVITNRTCECGRKHSCHCEGPCAKNPQLYREAMFADTADGRRAARVAFEASFGQLLEERIRRGDNAIEPEADAPPVSHYEAADKFSRATAGSEAVTVAEQMAAHALLAVADELKSLDATVRRVGRNARR